MVRGFLAVVASATALLLPAAPPDPLAPRADAPVPEKKNDPIPWPAGLPMYDHVVIVVEENKDYEQIVGCADAPFINTLRKEGANFTQMYGEEHYSQGNYFWLFSGSNQGVGFRDGVPQVKIDKKTPNLGAALIARKLSFRGYSEDLPGIGSEIPFGPRAAEVSEYLYARKHVPWISFDNVPNTKFVETSCNLRFADFPTGSVTRPYSALPTVAFVIPNLINDMHDQDPSLCPDEAISQSVRRGDAWLKNHLESYYKWAKSNNSLLLVTFDENDDRTNEVGLTDPFSPAGGAKQNRICTIFAGAHIKPGDYPEGKGITHVNVLRTLEAMYRLPRAGRQQQHAAAGGIADDFIVTDVFEKVK